MSHIDSLIYFVVKLWFFFDICQCYKAIWTYQRSLTFLNFFRRFSAFLNFFDIFRNLNCSWVFRGPSNFHMLDVFNVFRLFQRFLKFLRFRLFNVFWRSFVLRHFFDLIKSVGGSNFYSDFTFFGAFNVSFTRILTYSTFVVIFTFFIVSRFLAMLTFLGVFNILWRYCCYRCLSMFAVFRVKYNKHN